MCAHSTRVGWKYRFVQLIVMLVYQHVLYSASLSVFFNRFG